MYMAFAPRPIPYTRRYARHLSQDIYAACLIKIKPLFVITLGQKMTSL